MGETWRFLRGWADPRVYQPLQYCTEEKKRAKVESNPFGLPLLRRGVQQGAFGLFAERLPLSIATLDETALTQVAGCGGHEVRSWVAAYAAMAAAGPFTPRHILYHPIPQWNAGMGIAAADPV